MKAASLRKRSWKPFLCKDHKNKWYTGWDGGYALKRAGAKEYDEPHEIRTLKITPVDTTRGRSSANMVFEDEDGFRYLMGLDGGFQLVRKFLKNEITKDGEYLIGHFVQVKRGSNLLIESVDLK